MYWLARMVAAGEDPGFIFRRMLISACEDTGLADPNAITVVESCAAAFDRVGLPEGRYHLTHAALYLATAPKSNSAMAFFDALASVEKEDTEVPNHLRDGSRDAEGFGHGQGYIYPHTYREHWAAQQYLPDPLVGKVFYTPSIQGYEGSIRDGVLTRRELQIATILEGTCPDQLTQSSGDSSIDRDGASREGAYDRFYFGMEGKKREYTAPKGEILTFSPGGTMRDEWTKRLDSGKSETLLRIRNTLTGRAEIIRHHRVLVYGADDGLLIWEAGRLAPEGFSAGLCRSVRAKEILEQYAATLDEMDRPYLAVMPEHAGKKSAAGIDSVDNPFGIPFDCILARDPASTKEELCKFAESMRPLCAPGGKIVFSVRIPARGMSLSRLLPENDKAKEAAAAAEDALYSDHSIPLFAWDETSLTAALEKTGFQVSAACEKFSEPRRLSLADLERWFNPEESPYAQAVVSGLGPVAAHSFRKKLETIVRTGPQNWEYEALFYTIMP